MSSVPDYEAAPQIARTVCAWMDHTEYINCVEPAADAAYLELGRVGYTHPRRYALAQAAALRTVAHIIEQGAYNVD